LYIYNNSDHNNSNNSFLTRFTFRERHYMYTHMHRGNPKWLRVGTY